MEKAKGFTVRYKGVIISLACVSLICTLLMIGSYFNDFINALKVYNDILNDTLPEDIFFNLSFFFDVYFFDILVFLVGITQCILLGIYVFSFSFSHKAKWISTIAKWLFPIIFGSFVICDLLNIVRILQQSYNYEYITIYLLHAVLFAVATVFVLKGARKKAYFIVVLLLDLLPRFFFYKLLFIIGPLCLSAAIALFIIFNPVPACIKIKKLSKMKPKKALIYLKNEFDLGELSEEEYKAKKAEVLQHL